MKTVREKNWVQGKMLIFEAFGRAGKQTCSCRVIAASAEQALDFVAELYPDWFDVRLESMEVHVVAQDF